MRKAFLVILTVLISAAVFSQDNEAYSDGIIKLMEDKTFGANIDWQSVFADNSQIGKLRDDLAVSDDGTIFISNYKENKVQIFNKDGEYINTFGKQGWNPGEFIIHVNLHSFWKDQYLITSDGQGRIQFFDFEGNLWKMVRVDYMVDTVIPLENGKIAILGFVVATGGWKRIICIKDIESGDEKIIWSVYRKDDEVLGNLKISNPRDEINKDVFENEILANLEDEESRNILTELYEFKMDKYILDEESAREQYWGKLHSIFREAGYKQGIYSFTNPSVREYCFIDRTKDGNIILGVNTSSDLLIFSPEGKHLQTIATGIEPVPITENDINQFYVNTVNDLRRIGLDVNAAERIKETGFFPESLPFYYDMITDSNGNLLLFTFTDDKPEYRFDVYSVSPDDNVTRNCLFDTQNLQINLTPMANNKTIVNGHFYTIAADPLGSNQNIRIIKALMK